MNICRASHISVQLALVRELLPTQCCESSAIIRGSAPRSAAAPGSGGRMHFFFDLGLRHSLHCSASGRPSHLRFLRGRPALFLPARSGSGAEICLQTRFRVLWATWLAPQRRWRPPLIHSTHLRAAVRCVGFSDTDCSAIGTDFAAKCHCSKIGAERV